MPGQALWQRPRHPPTFQRSRERIKAPALPVPPCGVAVTDYSILT